LLGGVQTPEGSNATEAASKNIVEDVSIDAVRPNPHQPRSEFSQDALQELADSIKSQGVLQPILVRTAPAGGYELVAGERRLRAAKLAGLSSIPALVRQMSDRESLAIALIENLQREDLNPVEEAKGYQQLLQQFGLGQEELARQVGKSRSALSNSMRLLQLSEEILQDIATGVISAGHGRAIVSIADAGMREALARRIKDAGLTVRQAEQQASFWKLNGVLPEGDALTGKRSPEQSGSRQSKAGKDVDPKLAELSEALSQQLNLMVKVGGAMDSGRVTIQYKTEKELSEVLQKLGVDFETPPAR
jgi:ParB family chromosome partitioning protein